MVLQLALASRRNPLPPKSVQERLAVLPRRGLPIAAAVEIYWNEHLVPYVDARSDRDLAVALGLVHAHLRLGQMEMLRRIASGRLAEVLGPVGLGLDHALQLLDLGRAIPAILRALPDQTREWLDGFVAGINHHLTSTAGQPIEFRLLGISAKPWRIEDVLRVARLAAVDVNWIVWLRLLSLPHTPDWPEIWTRLVAEGAPEPEPTEDDEAAARALLGAARPGSNAAAVAGCRSVTGYPWLVGDSHLGLTLPCLWLAAAYRSPSYNVAGLMIPGIPVMAIGRNPWIAWGGANLHAASSELFDVGGFDAGAITERRVRLAVRWSRERELVLRETEHGPIISDAAMVGGDRPIALRWVGHEPSDEISALLVLNQARDWNSFRRAVAGFAVPGQALVYADRNGHIGRLHAASLPRRPQRVPADFVSPLAAAAGWAERAGADELPAEFDPASGLVVAANERPPTASVPLGWFFSPVDRALRLAELLDGAGPLGIEDFVRLQQDVLARGALELRDRLLAATPVASPIRSALASWDGNYDVESAGALAFELVFNRLAAAAVPRARRAAYGAIWSDRRLLAQDIAALPSAILAHHLRRAIRQAEPRFECWRCWGAVHRLRLTHPLAAAPVLGRRYRFGDWPWPGSNDTLMRAAHRLVDGPHAVGYGSNARYLFDLSDPDGNHVVLLGGQDGTPGSDGFLDQVDLFRRGETIRVPLRTETARTCFPHRTRLEPRP